MSDSTQKPLRHKILSLNKETKTGICVICGPVTLKVKNMGKSLLCHNSQSRWNEGGGKRRPYKISRGNSCERCGFIPVHICQLDVHHLDQNNRNDNLENLVTLCANCHRLVHAFSGQQLPKVPEKT